MKGAVNRWEEFSETVTRTERWLTGVGDLLKDYPQSRGEVGEMKTLVERIKSHQMELERKKADLDHLRSEATELAAWAGNFDTIRTVDDLQVKWDQLASIAQNYRHRLDEEVVDYNSYHQALQDTEKWILQTSFHLMAHNSMYITTRQQTDEQTKKHNVSLFHLFDVFEKSAFITHLKLPQTHSGFIYDKMTKMHKFML